VIADGVGFKEKSGRAKQGAARPPPPPTIAIPPISIHFFFCGEIYDICTEKIRENPNLGKNPGTNKKIVQELTASKKKPFVHKRIEENYFSYIFRCH
jgi:hypothetical protein